MKYSFGEEVAGELGDEDLTVNVWIPWNQGFVGGKVIGTIKEGTTKNLCSAN